MSASSLISLGLIEKDAYGDVLWTWAYPSVTTEQRELFLKKCGLESNDSVIECGFCYGKFQHQWYYLLREVVTENAKLPKLRAFCIVLLTKEFHPEKYHHLLELMSSEYQSTGSPVTMMQCFLDVVTKGTLSSSSSEVDIDEFNLRNYSTQEAYLHSSIKDTVNKFGLESILIYTALLLKKRIIVYHSKVDELHVFLRTLPILVWHRQNWDILFPNVQVTDTEINDLKGSSHYAAGFTDPTIENRKELYDVFVNLQALEISVAPHAKESMAMGKLHKDIALTMVQCAENNEISPKHAVKEISNKTKELLNNLQKFATVGEDGKARLTLQSIKEQKLQTATENFLYNLATAEGLVDL